MRMKRLSKYDKAKEIKRQKLLEEIEDRKLPYLTPEDVEFEQLHAGSHSFLPVCSLLKPLTLYEQSMKRKGITRERSLHWPGIPCGPDLQVSVGSSLSAMVALWLLLKAKYSKLHLNQASCVPAEIHQKVHQGLTALRDYKCFAQDLVQIKGKDVLTPVYRLLIGNPGHTYRYLDTRLFAIPWPTHGAEVMYSNDEIGKACQAIKDLNQYLHEEAMKILLNRHSAGDEEMGFVEKPTSTSAEGSDSVKRVHCNQSNAGTALKNRTSFNVALLNYMDPSKMTYLKEEPYFGMGKMAVSWHHDENLVERSTVAVYNYSCEDLGPASDQRNKSSVKGRDPTLWHVGLKIAWDIATPGLTLPLYPGDCYFMLDDFNMTHQHCVLSGMQARFSSTHRVAECSSGTLDYIFGRCDVAMKNLQKDSTLGISSLTSLNIEFVRQTEEIHNEVEFEWLRQFWFQGKRSAKLSNWWFGPMAVLENSWKEMEQMTAVRAIHLLQADFRHTGAEEECGVSPDLPIIYLLMSSQNVALTGTREILTCLFPLTWKKLFHF
ncbi:alpha-ketoglutarate-dependent dioxygenase FTO isoform X4 [Mobula hypostoma]|uniref:alpha-ketoglutarate-dependent dioxygenase FTO isoform X4 n=1 Tax=Mobula hypostoma TaxID=723540 RepID=UPI002FC35C2E